MRSEDGEIADVMCRAPYGTAEIDSIKLQECNSCDHLLRYCNVACQEDHTLQHEQDYTSRAAEKRDDILYRQPESSHLGDCPICLLPLSLDTKHSIMQSCCSKMICIGCYCASIRYEVAKMIKIRSCPFCRQPEPKTEAEIELYKMKRRKVNDVVAIQEAGKRRYHDGDYEGAFDYFSKATGLGDEAEAHYCLSFMYKDGKGVGRDAAKRLYHLEEAAIGGQPKARHDLGVHEVKRGSIERAVKHFIIAANLGHDGSVKALRELYAAGNVSKEDFCVALYSHKAAIDATTSPQREAAVALGAMHFLAKSRSFIANSK